MSEPQTDGGARHRFDGWPRWAHRLALVGVALLAACALAQSGALGPAPVWGDLGDASRVAVTALATAAAFAAAVLRRDLAGWGLIALALASNSLGEICFWAWGVDPVAGPYPSPADLFYFAYYALILVGLRNVVWRGAASAPLLPALLVPLLGLATLWSVVVFDPVLGSLQGDTAARMLTAAYAVLDLLLVGAALFAFAANGWRLGPSLLALTAGVATIGVADSLFASQVASGSVPDRSPAEALWPAGAFLIGLAPWLGSGRVPKPGQDPPGEHGRRLELAFSIPAVGVAAATLVLDHFERLHDLSVVLAGATIIAAAARLAGLYAEATAAQREAQRAELERGRIERLHTAAAEAALEAIITVDGEGRILDWNPAAQRIFGYARQQALGQDASRLLVPESVRAGYDEVFARFAAGQAEHLDGRRIEMKGLRSDGHELPVEVAVARVGTDPPLFTAFVTDITERKQREAQREWVASMVRSTADAMYAVNRELLVVAWNAAAERVYGYRADEIIGSKLERLVPADRRDQLARLIETAAGGEAVTTETERLRKDGRPIDVSLWIYPVRDELERVTAYSIVARDISDRRRAEQEQRLQRERAAWRSQIEDALERDAFEFHRQPVLDLGSGSISHHELLLRMRLDGEIVLPGRFLPFAERSTSLIRRIDRWAIRRGIGLAAERPVAINLSAKSLGDAGIAGAVQEALNQSGADPADVTFEITETAAAEQLEDAHALIGALRGLGCGVALDDFGTGYGSFTYLLKMPVTALKIDLEFIRALSRNPADQRVVGSILAVARNFGLTTVAEGVEEQSTLELLRGLGVDAIQGYLIGRPGPEWASEAEIAERVTVSGR